MNFGDLLTAISHPKRALNYLRQINLKINKYILLNETFLRQDYYWLASKAKKGTTVIDVGASIGDTAIYFAMFPNIKKIIAYEPIPKTFKELQMTLRKNPFKNKITIRRQAISDKAGSCFIDNAIGEPTTDFHTSSAEGKSGKQSLVEMIPLENAINGLKNVIIKCDVEGGEFKIFNKAINLKNVYAIQLEYHDLPDKLVDAFKNKGFQVRLAKRKAYHLRATGFLYAWRK